MLDIRGSLLALEGGRAQHVDRALFQSSHLQTPGLVRLAVYGLVVVPLRQNLFAGAFL